MYSKYLIIQLYALLLLSCKPTQSLDTTSEFSKTKNQSSSIENHVAIHDHEENYKLLNGEWRLSSYSAFMSPEDLEKMPDFKSEKVIYSIKNNAYELKVNRDNPKGEYDYALPEGTYMFWANHSIVNISGQLFMYTVNEKDLKLDSNIDPSLGPDGIVYYFTRL